MVITNDIKQGLGEVQGRMKKVPLSYKALANKFVSAESLRYYKSKKDKIKCQ